MPHSDPEEPGPAHAEAGHPDADRSDTGSDQDTAGRQGATSPPTEEAPQGTTNIAPQVVQKVVALAAQEVTGIHAMGDSVSRTVGALRERIPGSGTSRTSGVQVEVGRKQTAIDLDVIVEYGAPMVDLTRSVRSNVITAVEQMTGLHVIEVNIAVNDVHLPAEDSVGAAAAESRVQ